VTTYNIGTRDMSNEVGRVKRDSRIEPEEKSKASGAPTESG
jgi:hypothetical protein